MSAFRGRAHPCRGAGGHLDGWVDPTIAALAHLAAVDAARRNPRPTARITCRRCGCVPRRTGVGEAFGGYTYHDDDGTWTCGRYPKCEALEGQEDT